ncbi:hypothetical protein ACN47E_001758 [Coniothyrium glycines]
MLNTAKLLRKTILMPNQLAELKKGPRTNILIGPDGDRFIGLEGTSSNLLAHFSHFAKKKLLEEGTTVLCIPNGSKSAIVWIYKYMSSGEQDPSDLTPFEDFSFDDLVLLYQHCAFLEFNTLRTRIVSRLKRNYLTSLPSVKHIQLFQSCVPELYEYCVLLLASEMVNPWTCNYTAWQQLSESNKAFGKALDTAIQKILTKRVKVSEDYYGSTTNRQVLWSKAYLDKAGSAPRSPRPQPPPPVPTNKTAAKQKKKKKNPFLCYACGEQGHSARTCTSRTTAQAANPVPSQPSTPAANTVPVAPPPRPSAKPRGPVRGNKQKYTCRKCAGHGHSTRKCPSNLMLNAAGKPIARPATGRNKDFRRAQQDRQDCGIELFEDGEGLTTCVREAQRGEVTRTGLRI